MLSRRSHIWQRSLYRLLYPVVVLAGLCVAGCAQRGGCDATAYRAQVVEIVQRWDSANAVAQHASLAGLPAHIRVLQSLEHDAQALPVPACAQATQQLLVRSMSERIEGLLLSLDQSPDAALRMHLIAADSAMAELRLRLDEAAH